MSNPPQELDHDKLLEDYEAFVKFFNEEKIPLHPCVCCGRNIKYFRNADMFKAFKEHKEVIPGLLKNVHYNTILVTDQDIKDFIACILQNMVVLKLCWKGEDRSELPSELGISRDQTHYEETAFYGWVIVADASPNLLKMMTLMLVPVGLIVIMWLSVTLRIAFYYLFVAFFLLCLIMVILKLKLYFLFSIFNKDVILFPNLFEEHIPMTELFRPAVAVFKLHPEKGKRRKYVTIAILAILIAILLVNPDPILSVKNSIISFAWRCIEAGKNALAPPEATLKVPKFGGDSGHEL